GGAQGRDGGASRRRCQRVVGPARRPAHGDDRTAGRATHPAGSAGLFRLQPGPVLAYVRASAGLVLSLAAAHATSSRMSWTLPGDLAHGGARATATAGGHVPAPGAPVSPSSIPPEKQTAPSGTSSCPPSGIPVHAASVAARGTNVPGRCVYGSAMKNGWAKNRRNRRARATVARALASGFSWP